MASDMEEMIEREFDRIEEADVVTAEDLDRLRRKLPTDPQRARLVDAAMPYPLSEVFEYVSGSEHQSAYWRVSPDRTIPRSQAEADVQERFAEAARQAEGATGTIEHDDREIPVSAKVTAEAVSGARTARNRAARSGRKALRRLREILEA